MGLKVEINIGSYGVRSFIESDVSMLSKYANNPKFSANFQNRFPHPFTEKDAGEWIKGAITEKENSDFEVPSDSEIIGGIGFNKRSDVFS